MPVHWIGYLRIRVRTSALVCQRATARSGEPFDCDHILNRLVPLLWTARIACRPFKLEAYLGVLIIFKFYIPQILSARKSIQMEAISFRYHLNVYYLNNITSALSKEKRVSTRSSNVCAIGGDLGTSTRRHHGRNAFSKKLAST
jgi:hypothetical protein